MIVSTPSMYAEMLVGNFKKTAVTFTSWLKKYMIILSKKIFLYNIGTGLIFFIIK